MLERILKITDILTGWGFSVTLSEDEPMTYGGLLDKYLRQANVDDLIRSGRISPSEARWIDKIQDRVFQIDESGELSPDPVDGVYLSNGPEPVEWDQEIAFDLVQTERERFLLLELRIDRSDAIFNLNERGYNLRKWRKNEDLFDGFIEKTLVSAYGTEASRIMKLGSADSRRRFLKAVGRRIWEANFELYSRFIGDRIRYKDGSETLENIIAGHGGICSEKASAMKMISDRFGFEAEYLLAGPNARGGFPVERLREMIDERDFAYGKKYTNYWQHMALLYRIEDEPVMIDVTNGNVPFLFLEGDDALSLVDSGKFIEVRMAEEIERFYYHRVPQDIPLALLALMRDWVEAIDLIHVFDDGLGLLIRNDYFVWPVMYREDWELEDELRWWEEICRREGFEDVELLTDMEKPGRLWSEFKNRHPMIYECLIDAFPYLRRRYNDFHAPGRKDYNLAYILLSLNIAGT